MSDKPAPSTLRSAVWLLFAEAAGLGVLTLYLLYEDLTATANDLASALFLTVFAAAGAAVLFLLGRALTHGKAAARGPAIVLQLMLLPVGYYMIQGGLAWLGAPLIALALVVCGLLLAPPSSRALGVG